ncbi:MAG: cyanophycin synthetase family protein, partial [Burkholderiaceae bacterium]
MKIRQIRALEGPNLFHHRPVLSMLLDLGDLHARSSDQMPDFIARLLDALPGLHSHGCSIGKPGGFAERLHRGTYLGHIVEHVALALSVDAGIDVSYGKTVATDDKRVYRVVVRYRDEAGMRFLLEAAVGLVDALIAGTPVTVHEIVATAKSIVARHALGPSTQAIVDAADARDIPWQRIGDTGSLIRLGWGTNIQWIKTAVSGHTALIAAENARNKALTKQLLSEAQIAVPRGAVVRSADETIEQMRVLNLPVVIKPLAGNHGRGCT